MLNRAAEHLEEILAHEFTPFPKWGDAAWNDLKPEAKEWLIGRAELNAKKAWPSLRASVYMEFQRNGNRSRYQDDYYERRTRLVEMALAECIEGSGRFLDAIIDGIWLICEETSWVIPAHNNHYRSDFSTEDALPDFRREHPYIDLFSAETGSALCWVYYFLSERLAQESPLIPLRIEQEIKRRILDPYLADDTMSWMGLSHNNPVNNWNPWINSNVQTAFLLLEKDPSRRIKGLKKVARSAQRFLDFYAEDGGCDEGPAYFGAAGASLLDILEQFYDATDGRFSVYDQPLIANMADYIRRVHIGGHYFVNFADAACALYGVSAGCLQRAGQKTGRPELVNFARRAYRDGLANMPWREISRGNAWKLFRAFKTLFTFTDADLQPEPDAPDMGHYFPGIQVAVARTQGGLFFAAKGGTNAESHNHNDIGNYILYANGLPCVVDAGVGTYSRKTFSEHRYEIWSMQSGNHNTAVVNGCDQLPGLEYAAHSAVHEDTGELVRFALNMERAYDSAAHLREYRRCFTLNRAENSLTVTDQVHLEKRVQPVQLPILCYNKPIISAGNVELGGVTMHFDPALFTLSLEEMSLDDAENPITCWKDRSSLYRLLLTRTDVREKDQWTITYTQD